MIKLLFRSLLPHHLKKIIHLLYYRLIFNLYLYFSDRRGPQVSISEKEFILDIFSSCNIEFSRIPLVWSGDPLIDGNYPLPEWFSECDFLISPGIGPSTNFEKFLLNSGIDQVVMLDLPQFIPTDLIAQYPNNVTFVPKFLSTFSDDNFVSLSSLVAPFDSQNGILQMDIEGSEWSLLQHADLSSFNILLIEFHNIHESIFKSHSSSRCQILKSLLRRYQLVWSRPNFESPYLHISGYKLYDLYEMLLIKK